ncbi:MAG: M24 family metallopeptidase [Candidatus Thorarchaeota archaeon]
MLDNLDELMEKENVDAVIATGNAFNVADIYWLTGFRSTDPVIVMQNHGEESVVITSHKTLGRVLKESFIKKTYDLTESINNLIRENKKREEFSSILYKQILGDLFTGKTIGVPDHFPASSLVAIQQLGYDVKVVPNLFKDARATKSPREVKMIKRAGKATMDAISKIIELITNSDIGANNTLVYKDKPLTVGDIKLALEHFLLDQSAEVAEDTIIAVGKKGFDWHYLGGLKDKLKANVPIIMDVFPRLKLDRFVADVTRTVVRGTPSNKVRQMFDAVYAAQASVLDHLNHGGCIDDANLACYNTLDRHGFKSSRLHPGVADGMTHGLGHGIGLEVHENPSFANREAPFLQGHVVAVEPGIYLKAHGGVRYENDFLITKGKPKRLTLGLDEPLYL